MLLFGDLAANNILVSKISLTETNTNEGYVLVQFDLSWENSWRNDLPGVGNSAPYNWDAAWVFVKYRIGEGVWQHALLNNEGHHAGTGTPAAINPGLLVPNTPFAPTTNPVLGVFFYRSENAAGSTFSISGAQLRWNYGANGVSVEDNVYVKVFAVEMVYVPAGAFYVGSASGSEGGRFHQAGNTVLPFLITSENLITTASSGVGNLWGTGGTTGTSGILPDAVSPSDPDDIPEAFPKGYASFYCMKYEISQQQYVDFLNTLTYDQQNNRINGLPSSASGTYTNNQHRHRIKIETPGVAGISGNPAVYETDHPYVACNFLTWPDGASYSDWAGLRPMTELEFEKACRGTNLPIGNEFAWGTTDITTSSYGFENLGTVSETISENYSSLGNGIMQTNRGTLGGPSRVGIFAITNSTRVEAGASYYGIMELSGNLRERIITIGNTSGREYTGMHGNGVLNTAGHADVTGWPGLTAVGTGFRGGDWNNAANSMRVANRSSAVSTATTRDGNNGFRLVRTGQFVCGESKAIDVEGNSYNTVQIGNQCWMKENLNVTKSPEGASITRYCYGDDANYCNLYGGLYTWNVVMNGAVSSELNPSGVQGICPIGWHVPSYEEWKQLENDLIDNYDEIDQYNVGNYLKSCRQVNSPQGGDCNTSEHPRWNQYASQNGIDQFGFSALPSGLWTANFNYYSIGQTVYYWTSSGPVFNNAIARMINMTSGEVGGGNYSINQRHSIRCVKD